MINAEIELVVLNRRAEQDSRGCTIYIWKNLQKGSLLDLTIVPGNLTANCVIQKVWDGSAMQYCTLFIWAHIFGHGNILVLDNENVNTIVNRPHSWK